MKSKSVFNKLLNFQAAKQTGFTFFTGTSTNPIHVCTGVGCVPHPFEKGVIHSLDVPLSTTHFGPWFMATEETITE